MKDPRDPKYFRDRGLDDIADVVEKDLKTNPHKFRDINKKDVDDWAWLKVSIVLGIIIALLIWWSNHYHPAPDVCQTSPNSQSCIDQGQDYQNCQNDGWQC